MARYSDSASSDEAVLIETDDFALVYDRRNRAFHKKRWDSSTKSWTTKVAPYSALVAKDDSTVWAEDSDGKTIASGEAGVDDASVIQSAINAVEAKLESSREEEVPKIVFQGTFTLKNTIKITKMLHLEGGKFDIQASLGFEVFDGDKSGTDPQYAGFERMTVIGNGNDAFACRYCANWFFNRVRMFNVRRGLILERTWGDNQMMTACRIVGNPSNGEGLVHVITPDNDATNSFTIIGSSFYCDNDNAAVFKFEPQAAGSVWNLTFYDVYSEGYGDFFAGEITNSFIHITHSGTKGNSYLFNLDVARRIFIHMQYAYGNLRFDELSYSSIKIERIQPSRKDVPLINVVGGVISEISIIIAEGAVNSDVDYIKIGETDEWYDRIIIRDAWFGPYVGGRSIIAFGNGGRPYSCKVINCEFKDVNYHSDYPTCYALYYQGKGQIVENCAFNTLNKYEITNDFSGFKFINVKVGDSLFENSGTATFSGDGTTTDFEIGAHGLVITDPSKIAVKVTPVSSDAIAASPCVGYVDPADNTKIRVKFASAPASGSGNVKIVWYAEVIS